MKYSEWKKDKDKLIELWDERGIRWCENCGTTDTLSLTFHHIKRRSAGGGNEPENVILLCTDCHHKADNAPGYVEFNKKLKKIAEEREQ